MKKKDFGVTSNIYKEILVVWEYDWIKEKEKTNHMRELYYFSALVVIVFGRGIRGEEVIPTYIEGTLKFWE